MIFVSGPRQVGKTTTCRRLDKDHYYLNWDDQDDRRLILRGPHAVTENLELERLKTHPTRIVVFDEIHKYRRWKTFLKGLFDKRSDRLRIVVTGSARLDVYKRGGDSLMGRYLLYRMHPLSVGELIFANVSDEVVRSPRTLAAKKFDALYKYGGYPEPFSKRDLRFSRRWQKLRTHQLLREDIRDLTQIQDVAQLEILLTLLTERSSTQLSYSGLSREIHVSVDTVRRWIATLSSLHHGFLIRPWFRNVTKSLRKEPKWYLRDWSGIREPGQRAETFVACHLLKAVETWVDLGLGAYELRYLRDKEKREVDFVVIRDNEPWFLVEVKYKDESLSPALHYFQKQTGARHAFQVVLSSAYVAADCFRETAPCIVPVRTLLSQLP